MFRGINILDKIFNATMFALVLLCFSLSINNSYAQTVQTDTTPAATDPDALIKRAQELSQKPTLTGSEYAELDNLMKAAARVPEEKRNQATKDLLSGYDAEKKHSLMVATEAKNKALKDLSDYNTNQSTTPKNASQINPKVELQKELEYRELLLSRAQEDIDTEYADTPNLLALLKKKEELSKLKKDNSWIYEESGSSYSAPSLYQMANAMNASTDRNRAAKQKIKSQIKDMEKEVETMEGSLNSKEQKLYVNRKQEDVFIDTSQALNSKKDELQKKYCGNKSPQECHWAQYATPMEIQAYRDLSATQITTASSKDFCANSCLPYCYYRDIKDKCPFCSLFRVAFNVSSEMAYLSIHAFSGTFVKVVIIGFAIWIALQVLSFVSTISMVNFKNFIQPLLTQGFIVAFAVIILQNGAMDFFNLALEPIYNTGMKIAQKTISIDDVAKAKQAEKEGKDISDVKTACVDDPAILSAKDGGALPTSMGNSIICSMKLVYNRAAKIKALGSSSICYSWEKRAFIIPHIGYLMTGLGLWVGAMLMILGVPFMMIDSVLQLAVAAALLPLAIAAYAFKATRKHTKSVWETFLNSMFSFIFISLIALMLTLAFEQILINSTHGSLDTLLSQEADEADMDIILKKIPWWGTSFIEVVFVTILAWAMLREALDFASDFSSTMSKTNLGSQIATMGGSAVKGMAVKATSSTVEAGWQVAKDAGGSAYRGLRNSGRRGLMALQGRNIRSNAANVQTNKLTGAKTYTDANGNKVTYGSDGTMESVTRVKQSTNRITGRTTTAYKTKTRDVSITSMDIKNRNGTVVGHREIIRHNSSRFSELQNANGTINNGTIDAILANTPPEAQDKVKVAIAKEIIGQRHKNLGMNMRKDDYTEQQVLTDEAGRFIGFSETHSDGSKTIVKLKTGENGRMLTELTSIDKKGRGQSLRTDGIINSRSRFNTEDGTANGKINEDSYKTIYSVAGRYRGANPKNPEFKKLLEEEGMFESEEIEAAFEAADSNDLNMHQFRN